MEKDAQISSEVIESIQKEASENNLDFSLVSQGAEDRADDNRPKYIWSQAYTSGVRPGQKLRHIIYIRNPKPSWEHSLHATYFIGIPNFNNIYESWIHRDTRWQYWTSPNISLPGSAQKLQIEHSYIVPTVSPSNYVSIALLWSSTLGMEAYLDFSTISSTVLQK